jgi:ATP-dependent DNA ligase
VGIRTEARRLPCPGGSFAASAEQMIETVQEQGLEGVVAKRRDSVYESGKRSGAWVKFRIGGRQEFVVGGYTPHGSNFDSLIVGYYDGKHLMYAGRVRNGLVPSVRTQVFARFKGLQTDACPFANLPETKKGRWGEGLAKEDMAKCVWLKPKLVAEIGYAEVTPSRHLRHSSFVALRDDKERACHSKIYGRGDAPFSLIPHRSNRTEFLVRRQAGRPR